VTLGVPRIKEIFNSTESIATPIIEIFLAKDTEVKQAMYIKNKINSIYLNDLILSLTEVYERNTMYLLIKLDLSSMIASVPDVD